MTQNRHVRVSLMLLVSCWLSDAWRLLQHSPGVITSSLPSVFVVVVFGGNVGSAECSHSSSGQQARHAGFNDGGRDLPVPHPQLHNGSFLARPGLLCPHWRGVSAYNLEQPGTVVGRGKATANGDLNIHQEWSVWDAWACCNYMINIL